MVATGVVVVVGAGRVVEVLTFCRCDCLRPAVSVATLMRFVCRLSRRRGSGCRLHTGVFVSCEALPSLRTWKNRASVREHFHFRLT